MILAVLGCGLLACVAFVLVFLARNRSLDPAPFPSTAQYRVIGFTLFGQAPKYTRGMVHNARAAARFFPGWTVRVYCPLKDPPPPGTLRALRAMPNVELVAVDRPAGMQSKLWRFHAAFGSQRPDLPAGVPDVFISRDCDSRCDERDARAVARWLSDGRGVHIIRDHPRHFLCGRPMLAGLWGCRGTWCADPDLQAAFANHGAPLRAEYATDELFLMNHVYPRVRGDAFVAVRDPGWVLEGETVADLLPADGARHLGAVVPASRPL